MTSISLGAALTAIVGLGVTSGCAPTTSRLSGAAVEGAIDSLDEPSTIEEVEDIATSPRVGESVEELGASMVRGVLSGVEDGPITAEERDAAVRAIGAAMVEGVTAELPSPQAVIDEALASAGSERNREQINLLVGDLTRTMVRSATASLASGMREEVFPALDQASERVNPAIASLLEDDEVKEAVGSLVYQVSRQSTLGVERAMEQIREENRAQDEGVLGRVPMIGWAVLAGLLVVLLGVIVALVVVALRGRRRREELVEHSQEREHLLTALLAVSSDSRSSAERAALLRHLGVDTNATSAPGGEGEAGEDAGEKDRPEGPGPVYPQPSLSPS